MSTIRLLADDLTGALDTAAELVPLAGPVPVYWQGALLVDLPPTCGLDGSTRESDLASAIDVTAALAPALAGAALAYKKVDSLLRGHTMAELAACLRHGAWDRCIVAPAFPHQRRITRGGVQLAETQDGAWREVADIVALLAEAGIEARRGQVDAPLGPGVSVFDAVTDHDLARIAAIGRAASGRVLWCGSAGLAQALCRDALPSPRPRLAGPVLGLFGSDQEATRRQLEACDAPWLRMTGTPAGGRAIETRLGRDGCVLASLDLPPGLARAAAAARIAEAFGGLVARIERPGTLLVAGGETLRGLCAALGATSLEVLGQFEPGLPHSVMRGGRWDGLTVVSKSGAFGGRNLWRDLLATHDLLTPNGAGAEKVPA